MRASAYLGHKALCVAAGFGVLMVGAMAQTPRVVADEELVADYQRLTPEQQRQLLTAAVMAVSEPSKERRTAAIKAVNALLDCTCSVRATQSGDVRIRDDGGGDLNDASIPVPRPKVLPPPKAGR